MTFPFFHFVNFHLFAVLFLAQPLSKVIVVPQPFAAPVDTPLYHDLLQRSLLDPQTDPPGVSYTLA